MTIPDAELVFTVPCEECGGDGGHHDFAGRWDRCLICGGTGDEKIELHPETRQLVRGFSKALAHKLAKAEQKYGYRDNWRTDDWEADCRASLMRHIEKGDPLDVAAYCAFMWRRGWSTSASSDRAGNLTEALVAVSRSLIGAISIIERTPECKKAMPSDKMFNQMLADMKNNLKRVSKDMP